MKLIISFLCSLMATAFFPANSFAGSTSSDQMSFFRVPLVCNAAPFGCGSRSKPVLLDLQKSEAVKEAWLNRAGTIIAVVWKENINPKTRSSVTEEVFATHQVNVEALTDEAFDTEFAAFSTGENWYKGKEVDQLTIEESALIAKKIMSVLQKDELIPSDQVEPMQAELTKYIETSLLGITSADQLNRGFYAQWEKEAFRLGEKYLGKGNMPEVQLYGPMPTNEAEEKASCSGQESSCKSQSSCCSSKKTQ